MTDQGKKLRVTVFGAGITGLTAAHELVVRGFDVTIIDKDINECVRGGTLDRGIGGIARSQFFCRYPSGQPRTSTTPVVKDPQNQLVDIPRLYSVPEFMFDDTLVFKPGSATPARPRDASEFIARLKALIEQHPDLVREHAKFHIFFPVDMPPAAADPLAPADGQAGQGDEAAEPVDPVLAGRQDYVRRGLGISEEQFAGLAAHVPADGPARDWVTVVSALDVFPGEHGFRFFPSFYRHLFDTMKRTPILLPKPHEVGLHTVFDNLVPVDSLGFGRGGKAESFVLPRHPLTSFEAIRTYLRKFTQNLGYTLDDLMRFELMLFKYMTSCSQRRERDYEGMSWSEFVELPRYSKIFREHLEYGPQMMAALRGSKSDARTQGNILTQLLKDQVVPSQHPDATLDAPTSAAWFNHWKTYLITQGVKFRRGTLEGFDGVRATVDGHGKHQPARVLPRVSFGGAAVPLDSDYFVIAFSLKQIADARSMLERAVRDAGIAPSDDLSRIHHFVGKDPDAELAKAKPSGPLQHLAGIQFYFDTEVKFWRGHTQYLDSQWGLTSISQPQFWVRLRDVSDNFRSLLSVDIGIWDRPFTHKDLPGSQLDAWTCLPDQIATRTWAQIRDHHDEAFYAQFGQRARFPHPIAFALDQQLDCSAAQKKNHAPYLVAEVGKFRSRPGRLSGGTQPKGQSSYSLIAQIALAGTYMQTFTRLTSMEAANESARHAVNAILDDAGVACDRCEIWDPEDYELEDLTWFKDLDLTLFKRGLPHFVDTLGWRELPASLQDELRRIAGAGGVP